MKFDFTYALGPCADNTIVCEWGVLRNSACSDGCKIWLGQGDICLCINPVTGAVEGLCGDIRTVTEKSFCDIPPFESLDGKVYAKSAFKLFDATFISCVTAGAVADIKRDVFAVGDLCEAEMFVRVARNLIIGLNGGGICFAAVKGLDLIGLNCR